MERSQIEIRAEMSQDSNSDSDAGLYNRDSINRGSSAGSASSSGTNSEQTNCVAPNFKSAVVIQSQPTLSLSNVNLPQPPPSFDEQLLSPAVTFAPPPPGAHPIDFQYVKIDSRLFAHRPEQKPDPGPAVVADPEALTSPRRGPTPWLPPDESSGIEKLRVEPLSPYSLRKESQAKFPKQYLKGALTNLQELFRSQSLETMYSNSPVSAACVSNDRVKFVVTVLEDQHEYVVDVVRTGGSSMLYFKNRYAQRIQEAVESVGSNETKEDPAAVASEDPLAFDMDICMEQQSHLDSLMRCLDTPAAAFPTSTIESALAVVKIDLASAIQRGQALTTLVYMTDPCQSGLPTAKAVAHQVLLGEPSETVLAAALGEKCDGELATEYDSSTALTLTCQSVNLLGDADFITLQAQCSARSLDLVGLLVKMVCNAGKSPGKASLAAHILGKVCRALPEARRFVPKSTVELALVVGTCSHSALASAATRLLLQLE